jgi:hypothetical protein
MLTFLYYHSATIYLPRLNAARIHRHSLLTHPSRVALMCHLVASVGSVVAPSSLLSGALNLQAPKALPMLSHSFRTTHFTRILGALGLLLHVEVSSCVSARRIFRRVFL